MLQVTLIGNLGADAKVQSSNGRDFTAFRVAHTERWKDDAGQVHESTTWVDCVIDGQPKVFEYLKRGQMVYVVGGCRLRTYSSEKDRCMKAGMTISVARLELLGGKSDDVPHQLFSEDGKYRYDIEKNFTCFDLMNQVEPGKYLKLISKTGETFLCDAYGNVRPESEVETPC